MLCSAAAKLAAIRLPSTDFDCVFAGKERPSRPTEHELLDRGLVPFGVPALSAPYTWPNYQVERSL